MMRNLLLIIFVFLFFPLSGWAAALYLEPAEADYYQGDTFILDIRINSEGECVNAIEGYLAFSSDIIEVVDFSYGNSILTVLVNPFSFDEKTKIISFLGGIPGGYCGYILGDPDESNLLGKIIFRAKEIGAEQFSANVKFLETSQALLNDGFGTPAKLDTMNAKFSILRKPFDSVQGKNEWQEELAKDKIPPEVFKIEVNQDPAVFEGKYFIAFSTVDKQTGVDYYEIKEGRGEWQKAQSPYLLENQDLRSIIKVKAVDKAGNERIAEYAPQNYFSWLIIILILIGAAIIWWIARKLKTKVKNEKL